MRHVCVAGDEGADAEQPPVTKSMLPKWLMRTIAACILAGQVIIRICTGRVHWKNTLDQLKLVGPRSLGVALLTAGFVGMVFTIQVRVPARISGQRLAGVQPRLYCRQQRSICFPTLCMASALRTRRRPTRAMTDELADAFADTRLAALIRGPCAVCTGVCEAGPDKVRRGSPRPGARAGADARRDVHRAGRACGQRLCCRAGHYAGACSTCWPAVKEGLLTLPLMLLIRDLALVVCARQRSILHATCLQAGAPPSCRSPAS